MNQIAEMIKIVQCQTQCIYFVFFLHSGRQRRSLWSSKQKQVTTVLASKICCISCYQIPSVFTEPCRILQLIAEFVQAASCIFTLTLRLELVFCDNSHAQFYFDKCSSRANDIYLSSFVHRRPNHRTLEKFLLVNDALRFYSGAHQENYQALWFDKIDDPVSGETLHVYKGGYWEAKDGGGGWDMCPDIF